MVQRPLFVYLFVRYWVGNPKLVALQTLFVMMIKKTALLRSFSMKEKPFGQWKEKITRISFSLDLSMIYILVFLVSLIIYQNINICLWKCLWPFKLFYTTLPRKYTNESFKIPKNLTLNCTLQVLIGIGINQHYSLCNAWWSTCYQGNVWTL